MAASVVLISGAASGIGLRCAQRFAEIGATVISADITSHTAKNVQHLDVTSEEEWEALIHTIVVSHGRLDVLVNSAGILRRGPIYDFNLADFQAVLRVNLEGAFLGVKHGMKAMLETGTGSIINISSVAGLVGSPSASAYCASKGAVRLLTKSAALDAIEAGTRIRVNSVHPTVTDTPMLEEMIRQRGGGNEARTAINEILPARQMATVDDIADAVLFLASDQAKFINGSEIVVDNCYTAR